ncbi:ABC transporter substrate binding protein [Colwellia sp. TT2012]|uniref:ABC transporter substrate binding protein n=1 Tax=Colwellia sp. TT2012 TaxID=1720342 RepID=UPI00070ED341|nr:ABC transporter substrate binding protein [Colwellia sp. TT2012]
MLIRIISILVMTGCFVFAFVLHADTKLQEDSKERQILLLNSYHRGYLWSDRIEDEIRRKLNASGENIEIFVEYLDTKRNPRLEHLDILAESLAIKYQNFKYDLVITSDNNAIDFAIKNRNRLFPDVPIVFCGYNDFSLEDIADVENITGVNERVEILNTIELALSMHPNSRKLVFIVNNIRTTPARNYRLLKNKIIPKYKDNVGIEFLLNKSTKQIMQAVSKVSADNLVFILAHPMNKNIIDYEPVDEFTRKLAISSRAPVYAPWEYFIKNGVLGGTVVNAKGQGSEAAALALKILSGIPANKLDIIMKPPVANVFDYYAMKKFGLSEKDLPTSRIVINKPKSFYEQYKFFVWITGTAILILIIIMGILITLLSVRKKRDEFEFLATHDPLTGLHSRNYLEDVAFNRIEIAAKRHQSVSLLMIDLDHFKKINDNYGHAVGDCVLKSVGKVLIDQIRNEDTAVRFGGEEFVIILYHCSLSEAKEKAEDLRRKIENLKPNDISTSASIGVAELHLGEGFNELFKRADDAVYLAKEKGRNCVVTIEAT